MSRRWLGWLRPGGLRVSVVVPVFNAGALVDGLIASLDRQSLSSHRFEAIFVDDGSTDDSVEHLRRAAAGRKHLSVLSIARSGWPGKPRNVGTDRARGRYVFYADQDDELFPQALERMCDLADRNGADIVYGKLVRQGAHTPYWTWGRGDIDRADLLADPVLASRTVHKLFRRSFIADRGLRFVEGRVRLEDHQFMAQAHASNPVISVLESYPCYLWINRKDGTNSSAQPISVEKYLAHWTKSLEVLVERKAPEELQQAVAVSTFGQLLGKPAFARMASYDEDRQARYFALLRPVVDRYFTAAIDSRLPVLKRLRLQAIRQGDQALFMQLMRFKLSIRPDVSVRAVRAGGDGLRLEGAGVFVVPGGKVPFAADGTGSPVLALPGLRNGYDPRLLAADRPVVEITIRHAGTGTEWHVATTTGEEDRVDWSALIDPRTAAGGRRLEAGTWHVLTRSMFLGEAGVRRARLQADVPAEPVSLGGGRRRLVATAVRTTGDTLALRIATRAA